MSAASPAHAVPPVRHPWWAVSAVGLATFSVVTTEMLPVGLLTPIAEALGASTGTAGLMISLPALLAAVFAPLVVIAAGGIDRRRILCALLALLLVANLASALAPGIGWLLAARVLVRFCMGSVQHRHRTGCVGRWPAARWHRAARHAVGCGGVGCERSADGCHHPQVVWIPTPCRRRSALTKARHVPTKVGRYREMKRAPCGARSIHITTP